MNKIAIVAVAYNRIDSLSRLLGSLEKAIYNVPVTLIISIDKSNTDVVEKYADNYSWPHGRLIVDKHEKNLGLRTHMLSLGKWFEEFDALVVLEDDIAVSPLFYSYTCQAVNKYSNSDQIAGISLYGFEVNYQTAVPFQPLKKGYDTYFMNCAMSWGQVWMKRSWLKFYEWYQDHTEFNRTPTIPDRICSWKASSWLKYHTRYCIENNLYFVFPYFSLSTNCSDAGTHNSSQLTAFQVALQQCSHFDYRLPEFGVEDAVYYDGFFENKALYETLGVDETNCCLDLYGTRYNRVRKQYWLTTMKTDFTVVKSYGIAYRPIEANILNGVEGTGIYLYDTQSQPWQKPGVSKESYLYRHYIDSMFLFLKKYGFMNLLKDFISKGKSYIIR